MHITFDREHRTQLNYCGNPTKRLTECVVRQGIKGHNQVYFTTDNYDLGAKELVLEWGVCGFVE